MSDLIRREQPEPNIGDLQNLDVSDLGRICSLIPEDNYEVCVEKIEEITKLFVEKYGIYHNETERSAIKDYVEKNLIKIIYFFGSLENVREKSVLDVGSGSTLDADMIHGISETDADLRGKTDIARSMKTLKHERMYEPWFCRVLVELGASPVGVDVGSNNKEAFKNYKVDLRQKGALDFLPSNSFDLVYSWSFLDSPQLTGSLPQKHYLPDKTVLREIKDEIFAQAKRLLKDTGIMSIDSSGNGL